MAQTEEGEFKKRVVPWFNMAEWDHVYKQIYSDDTVAQLKGFERLLLWKARCPQGIPAGAQCTLDLIQICLKDREVWPQIENGLLPPYHEYDLQHMYSVAILRFLNQLATLTKQKTESLYSLASKLHIPDWVVNIRHETAHGHSLPSIDILREAAHFCLNWIHEHYWKNEAHVTADWIVSDESLQSSLLFHQLKEIVEMWEAVMLYSKAGLTSFDEIPDTKLQQHLLDEKSKYTTEEINTMMKKLKNQGHELENTEMAEAQLIIIKELEDCMRRRSKLEDKYKVLVEVLLEGDAFLASPDFMSVFNSDGGMLKPTGLPFEFLNLWKTLLDFLQQHSIIPLLMEALIRVTYAENESFHRRNMAALWIRELSQSLSKVKKTIELIEGWKKKTYGSKTKNVKKHLAVELKAKRKMKPKMTASHIYKKMMKKVEKQNPDMEHVVSLRIKDLPNSVTNVQLLKETVLKPNKWTKIFLPCLMELLEPPLPEKVQENLMALVSIYTQEFNFCNEDIYQNAEIRTVHNLDNSTVDPVIEDGPMVEMDIDEAETVDSSPPVPSHWIRIDDCLEWSKCPLGKLPWQREETMLNTDLPCDTVWQPSHQPDNDSISRTLPGFFYEKINWDEVLSHRPRKMKYHQPESLYSNVVEKAFNVALNVD